MSFSAPLLGSSPPAKTGSWPISAKQPRGGLSRALQAPSAAARGEAAAPALAAERRSSESGQGAAGGLQRPSAFSFSAASGASGRTPFSAASTTPHHSAASGSRPPPAARPAAARPSLRVEGFCAPSSDGEGALGAAASAAGSSNAAALSPGRLQTKSSLLTASLGGALSAELYGAAAPSHGFQGLVVLPDSTTLGAVDMAPLLELQALHGVFNAANVVAAYAFAARAHAGQTRKSGESVLSHLLATATILAELGMPEEVVAAGLLHDVLCDTAATPAQLGSVLPACVVDLVSRVSQLNRLSQDYRDNTHSLEAEAMLDMLTGMDDVSALIIKLADRLHNMRTIGALARCKQVRMASETLDVFAVLANRLGAWAIKAELEDLSFQALNPEEYRLVQAAVAARTAATSAASSSGSSSSGSGGLAGDINELTAALQGAGLEVVDVSGRVKNVYGVWKKVQKQLGASSSRGGRSSRSASDDSGAADDQDAPAAAAAAPQQQQARLSPAAAAAAAGSSFGSSKERAAAINAAVAQIYDVQALRVVVPHKHDCYAAMRVVQGLWSEMPGRVKDYIRQRKANGYQSLHLTVRDTHGQPLEIQIRTPKMHYIAEYGFAAHWRYKERLGRQDLWLDRLVQWKKWVASEKLGIVDGRKLRPSGSPGAGSGGDAALADLAERLQLERAASGGGATASSAAALEAALSSGAAAAAGAVDPMAAELAAVVRARGLQHQAAAAALPPRHAAVAALAASSAAEQQQLGSSPADEKFAARFRMKPISQAELEQHGARVMVSGPRGVSITQLPARCTAAQLLASEELTAQLRRAGSGSLNSGGVLQAGAAATTATAATTACRLAVNGVVVTPEQAGQVVLKSGDQLQLLDDDTQLLPLLGLSPAAGSGEAAAASRSGSGSLLPGAVADAGSSLQLFVPGQGGDMERSLSQKLQVPHRLAVRAPALVS